MFEIIDLLSTCDLTSLYSLVILSLIHYAHQPLCWQKCMQFMQSGQQLPVFVVKGGISPFTVVNWAEQLSACCWLGLAAITPHYVFLCQSFNVKGPTTNGEPTVISATTLQGLCLIQNQLIHPEIFQQYCYQQAAVILAVLPIQVRQLLTALEHIKKLFQFLLVLYFFLSPPECSKDGHINY